MIEDHLTKTTKQLARIVTSDPTTQRIEAVGKDTGVLQIAPPSGPAVRWPVEGELWSITRENALWTLDTLAETSEGLIGPESIQPGDSLIQSSTVYDSSGRKGIFVYDDNVPNGATLQYIDGEWQVVSSVSSPGVTEMMEIPQQRGKVSSSVQQTLTPVTQQPVVFNIEEWDLPNNDQFSLSTPSLFTCRRPGSYVIMSSITINNSSTGPAYTVLALNNNLPISVAGSQAVSGTNYCNTCTTIGLSYGDTVQLRATHGPSGSYIGAGFHMEWTRVGA